MLRGFGCMPILHVEAGIWQEHNRPTSNTCFAHTSVTKSMCPALQIYMKTNLLNCSNAGFLLMAKVVLSALPSQTVFDFLSQRLNRLCHFISDSLDYFLAGEDQQQTNQPNDLAGG